MVALALGVLIGAGIVMGLALDWIKHPALIAVGISQPSGERSEPHRESTYRSR